MTVIVGLVGQQGVLIAGDAQTSGENAKREDKSAKVFQLSDVLAVGYCGSGRLGQILQYHVMTELDDPPLGMDEHQWTVRTFIPHLRETISTHGALRIKNEVEDFEQSAFLLGVRGRLFTVWSDFTVDEHQYIYESVGSGAEVAIGSIAGELGAETEPLRDSRLLAVATRAIEATSEMTLYVGGKISSVKTTRFTKDEKKLAKEILGLATPPKGTPNDSA